MRRMLTRPGSVCVAGMAALACLLIGTQPAFADAGGKIDSGDTAWVLASSAMVMFMTPGLGLFYAGMVRRKNALATIIQSCIMCGLAAVIWVLWGYSLAFGTAHWGIIGSLAYPRPVGVRAC